MKLSGFSVLGLLLSASAVFADEPLPVEAFASLPAVANVRLSPDGGSVAFLHTLDADDLQGIAVRVMNLATGEFTTPTYAEPGDFAINWLVWANPEQLLISARFPAKRFGTPTTESRLLVANIGSGEIRSALPASFLRDQRYTPQVQDNIVDILRDDPDHILLQGSFSEVNGATIVKTSLTRNKVTQIEPAREGVMTWVTDRQHRPRLSVRLLETTYYVRARDVDGKNWRDLWKFEAFSEDQVWPMSFDEDPDVLYVRAYHDDRLAVFRVRLSDPDLDMELIYADDNRDVNGTLIYSKAGEVIGIRHSSGGGFTFWDDEYKALQAGLNRALPDTENIIYDLSDDERRYVALSTSDTNAGVYYIGDRDAKSLMELGARYPNLPAERMANKEPIRYEARDGLTIEGFLTMPPGVEDKPVPAIVFPHGGPISFDGGGFDYWTQFFANRGYAVLQMNFRGSAGYGFQFMRSGLQNWGLEMQNDVEDGTRWLMDQGIADPEHICIVGASYGGYAALMEAARNPDLYQCAVSFAGVTDIPYLVTSYRRYANYEVIKEQVGSDFSELRKRSPVYVAGDIDVPVLLGHGTDDRSVRLQHSRRMLDELEDAGKDVTYIEFEDGDHYLSQQEHRIEFFRAMDAFLKEHL